MNDVDVSRQIQQMVQFIRQEAEEKANEISVSAEEEFNIEKLQIVEAEKKKIRQEYERKEKQVDVRKKIFHPTVVDSVLKNAQRLNAPIAQAATVLGQSTVNSVAPCAQGATVVGHSLVNPSVSVDQTVVGQLAVCAQGAKVVGQQAVNPNLSGAQGATVVGQQAVNPDPSGAHGATFVGHQVVNPDASDAQEATIVAPQAINPDPLGAQGAMILGQQAVNPDPLSAQGAMNCDATGAQEAIVVVQCPVPELSEYSMQLNASRIKVLQAQDDLVNAMKEAASQELLKVSHHESHHHHLHIHHDYQGLMKALVVQCLLRLKEPAVLLRCRKDDINLLESVLDSAKEEYAKKAKVHQPEIIVDDVHLPPSPSPHGPSCAGGIVMASRDGKIVIENTLDARLEVLFRSKLPEIRKHLFSQIAA